jgi:hypothetical protein
MIGAQHADFTHHTPENSMQRHATTLFGFCVLVLHASARRCGIE